MNIWFGPAGIPLSCKGRTIIDGIEDVHAFDLNAMEIQLVRAVGKELDNPLEIKRTAERLNVKLSVHAPYYMDLAGKQKAQARSIENIKWSAKVAHSIGANVVVTHLGLYVGSKKNTLEQIVKNVRKVRTWLKKERLRCKLGLEMSGRQKVFGSLDEILTVCKRVSDTIPVINFAHIHAREGGTLKKKEDFQRVFDKVKAVTRSNKFYCHFSGVEHENRDKKRSTPIKKGDMRFDPLADCILDNDNYSITMISSSPLLEHDAVYMKVIMERIRAKREARAARLTARMMEARREKSS
jgi:deoxyribonuclease-4